MICSIENFLVVGFSAIVGTACPQSKISKNSSRLKQGSCDLRHSPTDSQMAVLNPIPEILAPDMVRPFQLVHVCHTPKPEASSVANGHRSLQRVARTFVG